MHAADPPATPHQSPVPKKARWATGALFLLNGIITATWVSRIPRLQETLRLSDKELGLALLAIALGALIAMPLMGRLISLYGSRVMSMTTTTLLILGVTVIPLAPDGRWLFFILFAFGTVHGSSDVAMNAAAVAVERRYRRSIMSSLHALFSLGGLFGAAMGAGLAKAGLPPLWHFVAVSFLFGTVTVAVAYPHLLDGTEEEVVPAPVNSGKARDFRMPAPRLLVLGIIAFCTMVGEGAMADWTGVFLRRIALSSEAVAASGYAAFSVTMAIGRLLGDRLTTRFGAVHMVRAGGALAAVGLALALLTAHQVPALVGFAAVGAGFATIVPLVFSAAGVVPGSSPGASLATVSTLGYFGFLVGPPLIGFTAEAWGLRAALWLIVAASLVLVVLASSVRVVVLHGGSGQGGEEEGKKIVSPIGVPGEPVC